MRVEHELEVVAVCPVDGRPDYYRCTVRATRTVPVEDILAAVKSVTATGPLFQEDLTRELHRLLTCEVETIGWHGRVRTRVVCGGP
jgi:heterodisulfide reductase subunit C